jgi:hypothetical protein
MAAVSLDRLVSGGQLERGPTPHGRKGRGLQLGWSPAEKHRVRISQQPLASQKAPAVMGGRDDQASAPHAGRAKNGPAERGRLARAAVRQRRPAQSDLQGRSHSLLSLKIAIVLPSCVATM